MENKEDLVDYIDRKGKELAEKLGLRLMTDEEWEEFKAKRQHGSVTGSITFLKGESAQRAASIYRRHKSDIGIEPDK